jgi:hypothetical protein
MPGCFDVDPRSHHGVRPPHRHGFPSRGVYSRFEPRRFDGPHFSHRGSCPTRSNGEVQRIVKLLSVFFFALARYRVIKIVCSCFEMVLRTMKNYKVHYNLSWFRHLL